MSTPAGWYPDPQQQDQLRYWDGAAWTEHQAPAQGAAPTGGDQGGGAAPGQTGSGFGAASAPPSQASGFGAASAPQQPGAGYGSAPAPGTADQTAPYGAGDPAMQHGTQSAGYGPSGAGAPGYGAPGGYGQPGGPGGKPNRTPLIVGGIVGVVILVLLIVLGVKLMSGGSDEEPTAGPTSDPTTTEETDEPTDDVPQDTDGGSLAVGSATEVQVVGGSRVSMSLTVSDEGPLRIYTNSSDDMDPVLTVLDGQGTEVASDDDTEYQSENSYDASVVLPGPPGDYTVVVEDYWGADGTIQVLAEPVGATELSVGEVSFELSGDEVFEGFLQVEPGTYIFDVASDADPTMAVIAPGGDSESSDDRSGDDPETENDRDPYLEVDVAEEGALLVSIAEYWSEDVSGTLTISKQ